MPSAPLQAPWRDAPFAISLPPLPRSPSLAPRPPPPPILPLLCNAHRRGLGKKTPDSFHSDRAVLMPLCYTAGYTQATERLFRNYERPIYSSCSREKFREFSGSSDPWTAQYGHVHENPSPGAQGRHRRHSRAEMDKPIGAIRVLDPPEQPARISLPEATEQTAFAGLTPNGEAGLPGGPTGLSSRSPPPRRRGVRRHQESSAR